MKKNNLILGAFLAITAILFSGCGASSSSDSTASDGVVTIGSQVWTSKNLDVATYRNGDLIPQVQEQNAWNNLRTGAWCYYDNDASNGTKYGKLYNWYAVRDPRGLAPKGYHLPTDEEWYELTKYLGLSEAGTKMKSTSGWSDNGNGTNKSGFSALPGGNRIGNGYYIGGSISFIGPGTFEGIGNYVSWWCSAEGITGPAWYRDLWCNGVDVGRGDDMGRGAGFYVRCVKD